MRLNSLDLQHHVLTDKLTDSQSPRAINALCCSPDPRSGNPPGHDYSRAHRRTNISPNHVSRMAKPMPPAILTLNWYVNDGVISQSRCTNFNTSHDSTFGMESIHDNDEVRPRTRPFNNGGPKLAKSYIISMKRYIRDGFTMPRTTTQSVTARDRR